jgi:hypothetical protein
MSLGYVKKKMFILFRYKTDINSIPGNAFNIEFCIYFWYSPLAAYTKDIQFILYLKRETQ